MGIENIRSGEVPRIAVIRRIDEQIRTQGTFEFDKAKRTKALQVLQIARDAYNEAREEFLYWDYVRHYRIGAYMSAQEFSYNHKYARYIRELTAEISRIPRRHGIDGEIDVVLGDDVGLMRPAHEGVHIAHAEKAAEDRQNGRPTKGKKPATHALRLTTLPVGIDARESQDGDPQSLARFESPHSEFSLRLQHFIDFIKGAYYGPGGFGSDLERAIVFQMAQVGHVEKGFPIVLHPDPWRRIIDTIVEEMYKNPKDNNDPTFIKEKDLHLFRVVDNIPDTVEIFEKNYLQWWRKYGSKISVANPITISHE